jgi:Na+-transporting NADH:ubiquinone oxidoreductase subunit C
VVDGVTDGAGWIGLRRWPRESAIRAIVITLLVCTVCSALIATTVSVLQPYKEKNRTQQRRARIQEIIATVPGLAGVVGPLASAKLESRLVELATGAYVDDAEAHRFDPRKAARDPQTSLALSPERDLAGIGRRAHLAKVFLVSEGDELRLLVLPVYGAGYISTLYGYLALDADLKSIRGLSFYEHGETPGLGSEIENPQWREQWSGKWLRDPSGELRIEVARGRAPSSGEEARYQVDGISGATRTGMGVTNLLRFWLGPDGFGPYLQRLQTERGPP